MGTVSERNMLITTATDCCHLILRVAGMVRRKKSARLERFEFVRLASCFRLYGNWPRHALESARLISGPKLLVMEDGVVNVWPELPEHKGRSIERGIE